MGLNQDFANLVKDGRQRAGWSQQKLAERMKRHGFNWMQSTAANTESGKRRVPIDEALYLAAILRINHLDRLIPDVDITCPVCDDQPPPGFSCNSCHQMGPAVARSA